MSFNYCKRCKKVYTIGHSGLCAECIKEIDSFVELIREYIESNPGSNVSKISEDTEISHRDILFLLREGRLILSNSSEGLLQCERCGKSISSGRYCDSCTSHLGNVLNDASRSIKERNKSNNAKGNKHSLERIRGIEMNIKDRRDW